MFEEKTLPQNQYYWIWGPQNKNIHKLHPYTMEFVEFKPLEAKVADNTRGKGSDENLRKNTTTYKQKHKKIM